MKSRAPKHPFEQMLLDIAKSDLSDEEKAKKLKFVLEVISERNKHQEELCLKLKMEMASTFTDIEEKFNNIEVLSIHVAKQPENGERHRNSEAGRTPLSFVAEKGNLLCVKLLVEAKATNEMDLSSDHWNPLIYAVREEHLNCIPLLLQMEDCPDVVRYYNKYNIGIHDESMDFNYIYWGAGPYPSMKEKALEIAVRYNKIKSLQVLLEKKVDVTPLTSLLIKALECNNVEIVKYLHEQGADINAPNALEHALKESYSRMYQAYYTKGTLHCAHYLLMHDAHSTLDLRQGQLIQLIHKEYEKAPSITLLFIFLFRSFLLNDKIKFSENSHIDFWKPYLLETIQSLIEQNSEWLLPLIHEKTIEYLDKLKLLPQDLIKIISEYCADESLGNEIVSRMDFSEVEAYRISFFDKLKISNEKVELTSSDDSNNFVPISHKKIKIS